MDSTSVLQRKLDALSDGDTLVIPKGQYLISGTLKCQGRSNITIRGEDAEIICSESLVGGTALEVGSPQIKYSLDAKQIQVTKGSLSIPISLPTDIVSVGDFITIFNGTPQNTSITSYGYSDGIIARITSIDTASIKVSITPHTSFIADRVRVFSTINNINIEGLKITTSANISNIAIALRYAVNSTIKNCTLKGQGRSGIYFCGINGKVENCIIDDWQDKNPIEGSQIGYGIALVGHNMLAYRNYISNCKHCISAAERYYMSTGVVYEKNIVYGNSEWAQVLDMHGNAQGTMQENQIFNANSHGLAIRGEGQSAIGNKIYFGSYGQKYKTAILVGEAHTGNARIEGNYAYNLEGTGVMITLNSDCDIKNLSIRDNFADSDTYISTSNNTYLLKDVIIDGGKGGGIYISRNAKNLKIKNINIETGKYDWGLGIFIGNTDSTNVIVDGVTITHYDKAGGDCIRFTNGQNRFRNITFIKGKETNLFNDINKTNNSETTDYQFEQLLA
jgi:hypothetical protein